MPRAIFFIKIARSYLFTSSLCFSLFPPQPLSVLAFASFYFHSVIPSILAPASFYSHPVLLSILPLLLSIPTSASICPRPEPDLLLDTPDLPVAVLFPTTFPCSDTPFSALYRVSRAVFLSFVYVSCRDTPFTAQKSVSRTKWYVFPRFPSRDTGFFYQKSVSQTENTYPKPTLNQNATTAHKNWPFRVCRKRKTLPLPPFQHAT